jgi:hypothetical protein
LSLDVAFERGDAKLRVEVGESQEGPRRTHRPSEESEDRRADVQRPVELGEFLMESGGVAARILSAAHGQLA